MESEKHFVASFRSYNSVHLCDLCVRILFDECFIVLVCSAFKDSGIINFRRVCFARLICYLFGEIQVAYR